MNGRSCAIITTIQPYRNIYFQFYYQPKMREDNKKEKKILWLLPKEEKLLWKFSLWEIDGWDFFCEIKSEKYAGKSGSINIEITL